MQTLLGSDYEPLSLFGSDDSLLLTFEGYDQSVNATSQYDSSEPWKFTDLDHLGALNSEDFLSLNLLKNSDAGNVLWEWAFESVSIDSVLLDEDNIADDGTLIISADDLPLPIRAIRFGSERDQSEPHIMTWKVIEGDARILEGARQSDLGTGQWLATLDIDKVTDNEVLLQGWLGDDEASASTMRRVLVEPGQAHEVTVTTTGQPYMAGFGQAEVSIHVQDRHGNNVADGTPVSLNISEGGLIKYAQLSTVSGMATAVVVGGDNPVVGATLTATALGADTPGITTFDILPLELSIAGLDGANFRGDQSEIIASVSAGGSPAPGISVDMVATHGVVEEYTKESDAQGQVRVPLLHLRPGEDARLSVTIGVNVNQSLSYRVQYRAPQDDEQLIESVETMVLGDQSSNGVFGHQRDDGTNISYDFATRSPFAVQGRPNEQLSITLGDLSDPNLAPMAAWNMSDLDLQPAAVVTHEVTLAPAQSELIATDVEQLAPSNGFTMDVALTANDANANDTEQSPSEATSTEDSATILLDMAGAYRLIREADGTASLEVNTSTGSHVLESAQAVTGSHRVEVHLLDGLLSFSIDEAREEIELRDAVLIYQGADSQGIGTGNDQIGYTLTAPVNHELIVSELTFNTPAQASTPNGTAVDETTLHIATTTNVHVIKDHPMGVGSSYHMNAGGRFSAPRTQSIASENALGFRLDIKVPDQLTNTATDTLVDLDGALRLSVTPEGKLQLRVTTTSGTQTLTSRTTYTDSIGPVDPDAIGDGTLSPRRWHTVAGRFLNGTLTLSVDGVIDELQASGTLDYNTSGRYTINAPTQAIVYNSFRLYDWNNELLLNLLDEAAGLLPTDESADQTDTLQVQLNDQGRATLFIQSRGQLNNQQAGSALHSLRVAAVSNNGRDTVSVISSDMYQEMLGYYLEYVATDIPAEQIGPIGSAPGGLMIGALNYLVPPAQAGWGGFLWGAVNFIVPLEDIGILTQQLYYLAISDDRFDTGTLIGSALGTLTIIPFAKPLKPILPGLKSFIRLGSRIRPSFYKSTAGPLGRIVKNAMKGRTDELIQWMPMIYVMGEMAVDAEARESLLFMINTISSEHDLLAWVRYLSMPANGWEGEGTPVAGVDTVNDSAFLSPDSSPVLDYIFSTANAQASTARIGFRRLNNTLKDIRNNGGFTNGVDGQDFSALINALDAVPKALVSPKSAQLRNIAHSKQMLGASASLGGRTLKNFANNLDKLRTHPVIFTGVMSYLYSSRSCNSSSNQCEAV